jgi:hypothetical protein
MAWFGCSIDTAQITALDNYIIVYKNSGDVCFYVIGDSSENELLLESVLSTLTEAISYLLRCVESLVLFLSLSGRAPTASRFSNCRCAEPTRPHGTRSTGGRSPRTLTTCSWSLTSWWMAGMA